MTEWGLVNSLMVIIKSGSEIAAMRQAGKFVASILEKLKEEIKPGIKTAHLEMVTVHELEKGGVKSSFKGYHGFPAHLCVSVNNEVVHGIPGDRVLEEGDIVSLDVGGIYKGFHADAAITVGVGKVSPQAEKLISVTKAALVAGITAAHPGAHLGDISATIQCYVESKGFSVVREYSGHGIGRQLHEEPQVPNFGFFGEGHLLKEGTTLALEPMVTAGGWRTKLADNQWTVLTADDSLAAHFEHTIIIARNEAEILTIL